MKNVYISCPISISQSTLDEIRDRAAQSSKLYAHYWVRDSYYDANVVYNADKVVFVHPKGAFKFNILSLPVGVQKELKTAIRYGKEIFLAYKSTSVNPGWNFYKLTIDLQNGHMEGIAGTTAEFFKDLPIERLDESKELEEKYTDKYADIIPSKAKPEFNKKNLLLVRARRLKS